MQVCSYRSYFNGDDPFAETLCSSGSISNLGRMKFRVEDIVLANLANNGLFNVLCEWWMDCWGGDAHINQSINLYCHLQERSQPMRAYETL